ncbi:MAG: hypothetical protein PHF00_05640 [Elusimicrobia bacterium]|nr:hypothetical protein [Elusimicrobiota bacterium]
MRIAMRLELAAAILFVFWAGPPVVSRLRHLCPARPGGLPQALAYPQFARRYGVSCVMCHAPFPRLNRAGFDFRRAGFRLPDELGQEAKFSGLKDVAGFRLREQYVVTAAATDPDAGNAYVAPANKFVFPEANLYPLDGAFGKYWGAASEVTFANGEEPEVEAANARATAPYGDWIFSARAGLMHAFEGFGASDRAMGNFTPFILDESAKSGGFDTAATLDMNQEGAEALLGYKDTTLTVAAFNGYNTMTMSANQGDDNNLRDLRVFFNQMLGNKAAFSALYYQGKTGWPSNLTQSVSNANPVTWINNYERMALFANYKIFGDALNLLGGYGLGRDHLPNSLIAAADNTGTFNSDGWFAQALSRLHERLWAAARYDTFKPSTRASRDRLTGVTLTAVVPFDNVKFLADYQLRRTQSAIAKDRTDNTGILEWQLAF